MKAKYAASAAGIALMAITGFASAQSVPVTVTNQGSMNSPSANSSGVTLGSFTLVSNQSGTSTITSIPLTLNTGSGGLAADLSACQVYSSNGTVLGTSGLSAVASGTNTVTFNSPFVLGGNQSASFSVRCNVGSTISSGANYQFSAGTPTLSGSTTTPAGASLGILFNTTPVVRPGAQDTLMGVISLSASNSNSAIKVSSIPVTASFASGAAGNVSDCRVRTVGNLGTALNTGANTILNSGSNVMTLDTPLTIAAGSSVSLALTCDVSASAPSGGTVLLSVTPSAIPATVNGSSTSVTPTAVTTANGNAGSTSGSVLISSAVTTPTTGGGPLIPGVPNTGFGESGNVMILLASAMAIILGAALLRRKTV